MKPLFRALLTRFGTMSLVICFTSVAACLIPLNPTHAAELVFYPFTGNSAAPAASHTFISASGFSISPNVSTNFGTTGTWPGSGTPYIERTGTGSWNDTQQSGARHWLFTVDRVGSATFSVTNVSFNYTRTSAGPDRFALEVNGTTLTTWEKDDTSIDSFNQTVSAPALENLETATIRIYGWTSGGPSGGGAFRIDDVRVTGIVNAGGPDDPSIFSATATSHEQVDLSWTQNGSGHDVLVAYNTTDTFGSPEDGTPYGASDAIPGGGTVIYNGSETTFNHANLDANVTYFYKAWSVNGDDQYSTGISAHTTTGNLPAPAVQAASNISGSSFDANWTSVSGATGYRLDVATNPTFGIGGGDSESFENLNASASSYDNGSFVSGNGIEWTYQQARRVQDATYPITSPSIGFPDTGTRTLTATITGGIDSISYYARSYFTAGTASDRTIELWVNSAKVDDFTLPEMTTVYERSISGINALGNVEIEFRATGTRQILIDDVTWTGYAPNFIPGYEGRDVGNVTSYAVTNLTPDTTYFYRVRATSATSTSVNSATQTVQTATFPTLSTTAASSITQGGAQSGGEISDDGGAAITARGVVWNTTGEPDLTDDFTNDGTGSGSFTSSLTDLAPGQMYFLRAYAQNVVGTAFGNEISFNTLDLDAPAAHPASATNVNSFTAAWDSVPLATGYLLDVSTQEHFQTLHGVVPVAGWNFNADSVQATSGLEANESEEVSTTASGSIGYINSTTGNRAVSLTGWDDGTGTKYWLASFSTEGTLSLTVSSTQRSSDAGPRDFKLQYRLGNDGTWADVSGGTVTVANNYSTGVLSNLPLPSECNNQPTVQLRWIMTSNTSATDGTVSSGGASSMHEILIQGTAFTPVFAPGYQSRAIAGGATTSFAVTGLVSNTEYFYRIRATSPTSTSAYSATQSVTTLLMPAPTIQTASGIASSSFAANWLAVPEAEAYRLDVSTNSAFSTFQAGYSNRDVGNVTTHTVTGLTAAVTYYYRVRAYDGGSTSANSATESLLTTLKSEPTNHATGFHAGTVTHRTLVLDWTDATGATTPDGYIVRGSRHSFEDIPVPVDGTPVNNSFTWGTGRYAHRIPQGTQRDELRQLTPETTYFFKLFPVVNTGAQTLYKTSGDVPQVSVTTGTKPFEDFEDAAKPGFASDTVSLTSGDWLFDDALLGGALTERKVDQLAARIRNLGSITMEFDVSHVGYLSLKHANFGSDTGARFVAEFSVDQGTSWQQTGDEIISGATLQSASFRIQRTDPVRIRIRKTQTASDTSRLNIDNLDFSPYQPEPTIFRFR